MFEINVMAFFCKTDRVCHVCATFNLLHVLDYTIIFGTLKDGSLQIDSLASSNCSVTETSSKMT